VPADPWGRVRDLLVRAEDYQQRLADGRASSQEVLGTQVGCTGARVCQIVKLLTLAPSILERIRTDRTSGVGLGERALRKLAGLPEGKQVVAFEKALAETGTRASRRPHVGTRNAKGFQHLFERARYYKAKMDSGEYRNLAELARAEGITAERIGQILNLLYLAPEIAKVVDVPAEQVPVGLTERDLRRIAIIRDWGRQVEEFASITIKARRGS